MDISHGTRYPILRNDPPIRLDCQGIYKAAGVTLYGGLKAAEILKLPKASSFHHEYSSMACTVEIIQDVYRVIDHIHRHGSAHTDCIITEDRDVAEAFLSQVYSATVFLREKLTSKPKEIMLLQQPDSRCPEKKS